MHHFARRTAGFTAVTAAAALLLATGCGNDDNKDKNTAASMTTTSAAAHGEEHMSGAAEETKIATQGGDITVSGIIFDKYVQSGGPTGPLGAPLKSQEDAPNDGKWQDFTGGAIVWSKDGGAHIVWGEIRKAWEDNDGPDGKIGYPTSDEKDIPGGKQSDFVGGTITWVDGNTTVTPKS
ncbi:LGFP repeat-containing protein [Nocardia pseudovaccinii]|uniref:LGFP repeat-containing protein n=1 Tax=Nocardia pseudovaccinii TaxID=189540 RepID=UPI0007A3D21B|nr:esterase [Nocardia pseudovaccinii]